MPSKILLEIRLDRQKKLKKLLKKYAARAITPVTKPAQNPRQQVKATTTKRNKPGKPQIKPADIGSCEYCEQPFIKKRSDARFCGSNCRVYASRARQY